MHKFFMWGILLIAIVLPIIAMDNKANRDAETPGRAADCSLCNVIQMHNQGASSEPYVIMKAMNQNGRSYIIALRQHRQMTVTERKELIAFATQTISAECCEEVKVWKFYTEQFESQPHQIIRSHVIVSEN